MFFPISDYQLLHWYRWYYFNTRVTTQASCLFLLRLARFCFSYYRLHSQRRSETNIGSAKFGRIVKSEDSLDVELLYDTRKSSWSTIGQHEIKKIGVILHFERTIVPFGCSQCIISHSIQQKIYIYTQIYVLTIISEKTL